MKALTDMPEVCRVIAVELDKLGVKEIRNVQTSIFYKDKGTGEFFSTHMSKDELPDWIAYQKTTNVFINTYLETATSLNYYWYSLGPIALGISTYIQLNENDIELFKRFCNVFELAYRRFLDIEKAEAQSRESQIQLALERVRARTMAMQHSDELSETASETFKQIQLLGLKTITKQHNGTIKVESKEGVGTTFAINLTAV